ncbi:MAG: LptA/OstA family protein [Alphaproteobacteria bacterium]|nr:LptA/OstA family protein [Alphaproteobacteria bacterium]
MMRMIRLGALALLVGLTGAGAAHAQLSPDGDAPIEVTSDKVEALRDEGRAIYSSNVNAVQGDTRIQSDKLTILCSRAVAVPGAAPDNSCEIEQMIAEGNVYYTTPDEKIRGDRAEYDYRTDTITVTGDVIMARGEDGVIRGRKLVFQVSEGHATITAGDEPVFSIFTPVERDDRAQP